MENTEFLDQSAFDALLEEIKHFGILECEEILTINLGNKQVQLRFANISDEDDIFAQVKAEGMKGFPWVQHVRSEILARACTRINGLDLEANPYAKDPYTGEQRETRAILADMFRRWGSELTVVLWKCLMVHCQNIEHNLIGQLPNAAVATEVEARFLDRVAQELASSAAMTVQEIMEEAASPTTREA